MWGVSGMLIPDTLRGNRLIRAQGLEHGLDDLIRIAQNHRARVRTELIRAGWTGSERM
jgi:hypothetical protein